MPRQFLEEYYSDEELKEMIKKLNALTLDWFPWRWTGARKEHEDLFGETIKRGETYFKRDSGPAWDDAIKLSRLSMERLLFALFDGNWDLQKFAEQVNEERFKRLQREHLRCSPMAALSREKDVRSD